MGLRKLIRLVLRAALLALCAYVGYRHGRSEYMRVTAPSIVLTAPISAVSTNCRSTKQTPQSITTAPDASAYNAVSPAQCEAWARSRGIALQPNAAKFADKGLKACSKKVGDSLSIHLNTIKKGSVLDSVFGAWHHPAQMKGLASEAVLYDKKTSVVNNISDCREMYLTRSGSRPNMPNKCVAVVSVNAESISPDRISHRIGTSAGIINRYASDMHSAYVRRNELPSNFFRDRDELIKMFRERMGGGPVDASTGKRRTAFVMVANLGMMDLIVNFVCSVRVAGIDLKDVIIFVGDDATGAIVEDMGMRYFYHPSVGSMPSSSAGFYGDSTFTSMMWLKVTAVYLGIHAGFDVLFQDADLVWIRDPIPLLQSLHEDVIFMDDGARSPRFAPLFVNSGFYYMRSNDRSTYFMELMYKAYWEIEQSHSHQSALIHHLIEAHHLHGLTVRVLDEEMFPSGFMFHHDKPYMEELKSHLKIPYVFHMCWTENRVQKIQFFKDLGLWFLPVSSKTEEQFCSTPNEMRTYVTSTTKKKSILDRCCVAGSYWNTV